MPRCKPVDVEPQSPLGKDAPNPQTTVLCHPGNGHGAVHDRASCMASTSCASILEEKTSRIMEVMLSTASAKEMMAGKILGVGAVGLTQVAIWAATAARLCPLVPGGQRRAC